MAIVGGILGVAAISSAGTNTADVGSMMGMLGVAQVINILIQAAFAAVVLAIFGGPPAAIYKSLSGQGEIEVF